MLPRYFPVALLPESSTDSVNRIGYACCQWMTISLSPGSSPGVILISASAVGIRLKFSSPCSISRRFSKSPGRAGSAFHFVARAGVPSANRMLRMRPGTSVSLSVPARKSCGSARIRAVMYPRATIAFCMRRMTRSMPPVPRQRPVATSFCPPAARWAAATTHWNFLRHRHPAQCARY